MLSGFSVKKPFTIFVAVVIVLIFGGVSLYKMTPDLFPSIDTPYVIVMTTDPGASAEEAENEITIPLEKQLATLPNMKNLTSTSADNYSMVTLEFSDDVNMDSISVDIRDKIEQIRDQLPESAGTPVVMKINLDMMPVVVAAVSMKDKSTEEVSVLTRDELLTPLEGTEGVAAVSAMGMIDDGLQIVLDQEKIDELNQRVKDKINAEIDDGKSKVKKGINSAKSGKKKVTKGKKKVTEGAQDAADKIADTKGQLLTNKAGLQVKKSELQSKKDQFLAARDNLPQLQAIQAGLNSDNETIRNQAEEALKQSGSYDSSKTPEENKRILDETIENLSSDKTLNEIDEGIKQIDDSIAKIEEGLDQASEQEAALNFDLGNSYSDLASAQGTLDMTISQLENTLKEIEDTREAALDGADLDNIITMENVSAILAAQNFSMPAGYVTDGEAEILVSVGDKIADKDEMNNLVLFDLDIDGIDPIRVSDIADVVPASADDESYARINGENGVLLSFTRQSAYATAEVADNIHDQFNKLEKQYKGLHFTALMDQGEYISIVINSVLRNLLIGAVLAILILLFFLRDIRPTVITAVSIPVSVVFALAMMYFSGVTLNMISLSGLAIGVGMLVDNSIVVIENTYRLRSMGYSLVQSAVSGAVQVAGAITASTLTTICVFVPIIFVDGMTRDIFMDLALTVTYSLLASLMIALTLVPAMAKGMLVRKPGKTVMGQKGRIVRTYRRAAAWSLSHKKWVLIGAFLLLLASSGILLTRGFEYMPAMSTPQISADIQMPEDSTIEETAAVNDEIMEAVRKVDGVETAGAMLSSETAGVMGLSGVDTDVTNTTMYIVMDESKVENASKIVKIMKAFEKKYGCTIQTSADMDMTSYMGATDIGIKLYSDDLDALRESAEKIEKRMGKIRSLENVSDITENKTEEIHISVDKNLAMEEGFTVAQVYQQISAKLQKEKSATTLKRSGTNIEVSIENASSGFTKEELEDLKLVADRKDGTKEEVSLDRIASIKKDASLSSIDHDGQKRSASISASVREGYNITKVTANLQKIIHDEGLVESGVRIDFGGQNEEIMHSMKQMILMLIIGFLLVYLIMVAQFQSIRSPLIIIFCIPLAFTGGMISLLITGRVLSVVSMMGFVMLMGIVVNNAIVLVDCINRFRLEGMKMDEAIINAGAVRMRPVIMTAVTTVLGLVPLALGIGNGAEMVQPVALVCIGGLIYATLTTLLVIPVMYRLIARKRMEKIKDEELEIVTV